MKGYQLGLYEKSMPKSLTWREKFNYTKEAGFDWLEISIDETDEKLMRLDWNKDQRNELRRIMEETECNIYTMCLSGHRKFPLGSKNEQNRIESLNIMQKAVDLAVDLGIRIIQLAGYDVYYEDGDEETKNLFFENLKVAVSMAAEKGVLLGFETMETDFMDTVEKSMNYVNKIDSPYLGVYPDIGNLTNASKIYNSNIEDDLLLGKGRILASHLKETIPGHYREIPFGTGHTNFIECLRVLKKLSVRMFVGEFWYTGSDSWEKDLKDANVFLREKLNKVYK